MKKEIISLIIITFFSVLLVGCGKPYTEGIVIKADSNTVLVAGNLSIERYKQIRNELSSNENMFEAIKKEVSNTGGDIDLVDFTYDDADEFKAGNEVDVWMGKHIGESFPEKAEAKKITLKE